MGWRVTVAEALEVRHDWSLEEARVLYDEPLLELVFRAAACHRRHHDPARVQLCSLLSIKTGGCPEDCAYCSQSARHGNLVAREELASVEEVRAHALRAIEAGATRFCMAAAWRRVPSRGDLEKVLEMVEAVRALGVEACCSLGSLDAAQAGELAEAGLSAYNHNLDTSRDFYGRVVTTRSYDERLATIRHAQEAGVAVCAGGIVGMGESHEDRVHLLHALAGLSPHPESVPINLLVPVEGTPLADRPPVDPLDVVRTVAVARILMPRAKVRLSAGRASLSREAQALAFLAGASSIFIGERLLTTPNAAPHDDRALLRALGLRPADREP